ncbi:histone deacetylase family protein [Thioclava sp. SK-1]|uniref:histone deacetylase family protein n=1 Tax=Thioclava sp. SK-1 TaxID=1889770 RepID=UPI0021009D3B|nr:histone deacetylase family protein [Thioclava sp. SK-1]
MSAEHDPVFRIVHGKMQRNAEQAERCRLLMAAVTNLGLPVEDPGDIPRAAMLRVHTERHLDFLENGWAEWQTLTDPGIEIVPNQHPVQGLKSYPRGIVGRAGWHIGDTSMPLGEGSWKSALGAAAAAYRAAQAVNDGERAVYALCRPPGHHADVEISAGHCLMNNAAIAVEELLTKHKKVATLDIDVHHGNGTQMIFYGRDDVLTCSIHADPAEYYPFFVGYDHETGEGKGAGYNLNLPLAPSTSDEGWVEAIKTALARIAEFKPDALVVCLGLDAHENDPLKGLKVTFDGFAQAGHLIAQAGYPTVMCQEGGYLSPDLTTSLESYLSGFLGKDALVEPAN